MAVVNINSRDNEAFGIRADAQVFRAPGNLARLTVGCVGRPWNSGLTDCMPYVVVTNSFKYASHCRHFLSTVPLSAPCVFVPPFGHPDMQRAGQGLVETVMGPIHFERGQGQQARAWDCSLVLVKYLEKNPQVERMLDYCCTVYYIRVHLISNMLHSSTDNHTADK